MTKLTDTQTLALKHFVHSPMEAQAALTELAQQLHNHPGIPAPTPLTNYFLFPNRPGWLRTWSARTAERKTTVMRILAINEAERLQKENLTDKHYVLVITYEDPVDSQEVTLLRPRPFTIEDFWRGKVAPDTVIQASMNRPLLPIWWMGDSLAKSDINTPKMTINVCVAGILAIQQEYGLLPSLILVDYAQEVEVDESYERRTSAVIAALGDIIRMAKIIGCPIELASQAKPTSLDRKPPIPEMYDTEYSAYVVQKSQQLNSMWVPFVTHRNDKRFQSEGISLAGWEEPFPFTPQLTIIYPAKSRHTGPRMAIPVNIDNEKMIMTDVKEAVDQMNARGYAWQAK